MNEQPATFYAVAIIFRQYDEAPVSLCRREALAVRCEWGADKYDAASKARRVLEAKLYPLRDGWRVGTWEVTEVPR